MTSSDRMRVICDAAIALALGLVWGSLVLDLIGYFARNSDGSQLAEISALAAGNGFGFVLIALAKDALIFAAPSLFIGYLVIRLFSTRPMIYAMLAGTPMFLAGAFSVGASFASGDVAGARGIQGVYMTVNTALVLLAIPACVALLQWSMKLFPGAPAQAR